MKPVLSILICTMHHRFGMLGRLLREIELQEISVGKELIEVLIESDGGAQKGGLTTGAKRNKLLHQAKGVYSVFIDDDDEISSSYLSDIINAAKTGCDAMACCGWISTNGGEKIRWDISKDNPYDAALDENGKVYYRRPQNHISPIKTSICTQFNFPDVVFGEDYAWCMAIKNSGLVKTETKIETPLYHYQYKTLK